MLLPGCERVASDGGRLTIVSPWSADEREQVEKDFNRHRSSAGREPVRLEWIAVAPGDALDRVVAQRGSGGSSGSSVDVALGGPASSYVQLARSGTLVPVDSQENRQWSVARRSPIGFAANSRLAPRAGENGRSLAFDDPRNDPVALAWGKAKLSADGWGEGYAQLVRHASDARRIGRQPGSALAAVEQGAAPCAVADEAHAAASNAGLTFASEGGAGELVEGVAVVAGSARHTLAQEFLGFVRERGGADSQPLKESENSAADGLLADLLGATLVDAQEELWNAGAAVARAGRPEPLERSLTEPPPWPPASVDELVRKGREDLLETLAGQIAPDPDVRAWLRRSWLMPSRLVDGALLDEMAEAVDGRLIREPRFRAWLRAEWTAWARQRYRRVARVADGRWP